MMLRLLKAGVLSLGVGAVACTASITGDDDGTGTTPGFGPDGTPNGNGTGGAGNGTGGAGTVTTATGKLNLNGSPTYYRVIRLTNEQWTNSVQTVLGLAAPPTDLAQAFQSAVSGTTDFTNNELVLSVDSRAWSDLQTAAEELATKVTSDSTQLSKLYSGTDGAGFINAVGRRAFRRPLSTQEAAGYQKLFDMGPSLAGSRSSFAKGASLVLRALLQSPNFLYRSELGQAGAPLSGYEMASKLSLWLRNSSPNDALLDAAAGPGKLDTADGAATVAQQMLDETGAKPVMRKFHGEFLHFDRYASLSKVGVDAYNPDINAELAETSYLFFDKIFSQGKGVKDIFTSTSGFVGPNMAKLYDGVAAPVSGFEERDLGAKRAGYFLQLPFLVLYAHNETPDSIHRGVSMNLDVLCAQLGPPAAVIPPLPAPKPGQTNRQRVDEATSACGALCHNKMINPMGFAFEHYDGMGHYRDTEVTGGQTLPIDSSGQFDFVDGTKSYKDAAELMSLLSTAEQAHLCYSKKLASFGLQRDVVEGDMPLLKELSTVSQSSGGSIKQVIVDLVKQDAFRTRSGGAK